MAHEFSLYVAPWLVFVVLLVVATCVHERRMARTIPGWKLARDMERRGIVSAQGQREEVAFRVAHMQVKREASRRVLQGDPAFASIQEEALKAVGGISSYDKKLAMRILQTIVNLPSYENLTPEAQKVHDARYNKVRVDVMLMSDDLKAVLGVK